MSIEQVADFGETQASERELQHLPRLLAMQALDSKTSFWQPDHLSRQMADDIAWEIGAQAHVVPVRHKTPHSADGVSYALQIDHYDKVVPLHRS